MGIIDATPEPPREKANWERIIVGLAIVVVAGACLVWGFGRWMEHRRSLSDDAMKKTAQELSSRIEVSQVFFNTGENFLGDRVRYLNVTVTNHYNRPLSLLELTFTFVDQFGQVVLRESKRPIDEHKTPLPPGEHRDLSIGFEKLPQDWNRQHPSIQITRLKFE